MKKLIVLLAIIGCMSMVASAQILTGNLGYEVGTSAGKHGGVNVSLNYHENHGMMGLVFKFPSTYDKGLRVGVDAGANLLWQNLMISPYLEISYNKSPEAKAMLGTGLGLQGLVQIVGPIGAYLRYQYTIFPFVEQPFQNGSSAIMGGVALIWDL